MSRNVYALEDHCTCCDRADWLHLVKFSVGWLPSLHAYPDHDPPLRSWAEIRDWLREARPPIRDEYGEELDVGELIAQVEDRQRRDLLDHVQQYPRDTPHRNYHDADGYVMQEGAWE